MQTSTLDPEWGVHVFSATDVAREGENTPLILEVHYAKKGRTVLLGTVHTSIEHLTKSVSTLGRVVLATRGPATGWPLRPADVGVVRCCAGADKWVPIVDEAKARAKGRRYSDSGVLSVDQVGRIWATRNHAARHPALCAYKRCRVSDAPHRRGSVSPPPTLTWSWCRGGLRKSCGQLMR